MTPMPMTPPLQVKVLAYLWQGQQLLVFRQPDHPEAGLQVPAGTVEPGEELLAAVHRELEEESGLSAFDEVVRLASYRIDMRPFGKDEIHERHVFALRHLGNAPQAWRHWELHSSDGRPPIALDLSWHDLRAGVPDLAADQGRCLPLLLQQMATGVPQVGPRDAEGSPW